MKTQLMFGAAILAVAALTGCDYKVKIKDTGGMVDADPHQVNISENSGTVKVIWKAENPGPWLVDFLDDTPCTGALHIFQNGGTTVCDIDMSTYVGPTYKYYAIAGQHVSADPQIYHMPTQGQPTTERQPGKAPTVICVDLPNGSPLYCDSAMAQDPVNASKGNIIFWKPDNGWTITIAAGVCGTQTMISSTSGYCPVTGSNGTYQYSVKLSNNNTYGPFSVKVQ
jgi:hypothetical protein